MTARFTDELRAQHRDTWEAAVNHRFVQELSAGAVDDAVMAAYLAQDYRFLDAFLALIGGAVATADTLSGRLVLARFAGEIAGDENTYFERSFEALGVSDELREATPDSEPTAGFLALFRDATDTRNYTAILATLLVTEWLYLDWATRLKEPYPTNFLYNEWIRLHTYPGFHDLVAFLRSELDRVGPEHREIADEYFARAVRLELAFFDDAYAHPLTQISAH